MNEEDRPAALEQELAELDDSRRQLWVGIFTGDDFRVMSQLRRVGARRRSLLEQLEGESKRGLR